MGGSLCDLVIIDFVVVFVTRINSIVTPITVVTSCIHDRCRYVFIH